MNWRSSRSPVLIAGEGQPPSTMTSGNNDPYLCIQGLVKSCSCRGVVGSAYTHVQSTAMRRPRPQAVRARGASCLPLRFSAKPSPRAPWAQGLLSAFWERGSPDLPAYGLRRGSSGGPVRPSFISSSSRPSQGVKPCGADDRRLPQEQPHQAGSRGGGEIKAGYLAGAHDASHDDRDQAGARRAPACVVSLFPLRSKGNKHSPRHRSKVTIPVQRDQDQQSGRTEVTMEPETASSPVLLAAEDHLWSG